MPRMAASPQKPRMTEAEHRAPREGAAPGSRRPSSASATWSDAGFGVFDSVILALDGDIVTLAGGGGALSKLAAALGAKASAPGEILARLKDGDGEEPLRALVETGAPFILDLPGPRPVRVEGRTAGALAFLKLELVPPSDGDGPGLRRVLATYPGLAWALNADGGLEGASPTYLSALGVESSDQARRQGLTLDPGADRDALAALHAGEAAEMVRHDTRDGRARTVKFRFEPLGSGTVLVWASDITDQAQAERTERRRDAALRLVLGQIDDAVALFDAERRLVLYNGAFAELWGAPAAWLQDRPTHGEWLDRLRRERRLPHGEDYAAFKSRELARHERSEPSEGLWRLPDGRTFRAAGAPHPDGGLFLVFTDLTDGLQAAARFNQLLQVHQATLDKLTDAVAVFGADARLRLHNEAFAKLWRLQAEALLNAPPFDALVEVWAAQIHDLQFWRDLKIRITDPDPMVRSPAQGEAVTGEGRRLAWQSRPLPDGATLVGFTDVTDARRIEAALAEQKAALAETERLKQEFVAAVSQELRTPLTTILGFSELIALDEEALTERGRRRLTGVQIAADNLAQAVDDILDLADLDAGEVGLNLETLDLDPLLDTVILERAPRAAALGLQLGRASLEPAGRIRGDRAKLKTALDRLVLAALDQTPPGGAVRLSARHESGEAKLSVTDTRAPIPYDVQARIFERPGGENGGPARLGLALARRLIELHGGWMTVESGPAPGATFTCHLPESAEAVEF